MKTKPYDMKLMNGQTEKPNRGLRSEAHPVDEASVEPVEQAIEEAHEKKAKVGVVSYCTKLNLRSEPKKFRDGKNIITELMFGTTVWVDEDESTDEFYKVCTEAGLEGYCMKEFIRLT